MLDKSRNSRLYDPEFEEPRSKSDWQALTGIDVKPYFRAAETRDTGNADYVRYTKFYKLQGNYLLGLPERSDLAEAFWNKLWAQRKHKALTYFSGKPKIYAHSFEQISHFIENDDLKKFAESLRNAAGPDLTLPDPTWQGSRDFSQWYHLEEKNFSYAPGTSKKRYFQDDRPLVERFLKDIHGSHWGVATWRFIDLKHHRFAIKKESRPFAEVIQDIQDACEDKREVYFSLCPSVFVAADPFEGIMAQWIPGQPRCFWVDFDKDLTASKQKEGMLPAIDRACKDVGVPYTHRVETRNGYHVYWVMNASFDESIWERVQLRLLTIFKGQGADQRIKSLGTGPRLPCTNHWKDNDVPFRLTPAFEDVPPYDLKDFMAKIQVPIEEEQVLENFVPKKSFTPSSLKSKVAFEGLNLVKESLREYGDELADTIRQSKKNLGLLCSYVGVQFGKHGSFRCNYHDDKNPSASIFRGSSGDWVYNCFGCEFHGDILRLIEEKEDLTKKKAQEKLLILSNREDMIGFQPKIDLSYLDENLKVLESHRIFDQHYNHPVWDWIEEFTKDLFDVAKRKIRSYDGRFPASLREISGYRPSATHHSNKLYLFRLVGLIQIAPMPSSLPSQKSFGSKTNPTSWHFIPMWTPELLEKAFDSFTEAKKNGMNTNKCNRTLVRNAYGEEGENRVFHGKSTLTRRPRNSRKYASEADEEMDRYLAHQEWLNGLSEEEFEQHLFDLGGEEFLRRYREDTLD